MTIERPMFPPRAESVDSISAQPAVDHRPEERPSGDSPRPAEGTSNVIVFPRAAERRVSYAPTEPAGPRVTGRQRAGFKRNPLRRLYSRTGMAVTIAGKLHGESRSAPRAGSTSLSGYARAPRRPDSWLRSSMDLSGEWKACPSRQTSASSRRWSLRWPTSSPRPNLSALSAPRSSAFSRRGTRDPSNEQNR